MYTCDSNIPYKKFKTRRKVWNLKKKKSLKKKKKKKKKKMGKMKMNDLQLSDTDSESDEESKYSEFGLNVGI